MAEFNVDAELLKHANVEKTSLDSMITMQDGCICCTLRGDLLEGVAKLAGSNEFDYILIESTGISEPMQVGRAEPALLCSVGSPLIGCGNTCR